MRYDMVLIPLFIFIIVFVSVILIIKMPDFFNHWVSAELSVAFSAAFISVWIYFWFILGVSLVY